jgi:hypothetical protein
MDWREMCLNRAADCEEKAKQTADLQVAAVYRALAEQWSMLADERAPPIVERPGNEPLD